jgi:hypothetical protein
MFKLRLLIPILALLALLPTAALPAAAAQRDQRCFAETGHCIAGSIRSYWENNGGLAVFGYPITNQATETIEGTWTGPVQWFERDRLEDHSNEGKGVLAGRLGARYLELRGTPWSPGRGGYTPNPDCLSFTQTGYQVCGVFRIYWEQRGGLERYGYPIGEPTAELIEGRPYTVQYFERRRMEYHPENAGTSYEVLLGLLGGEVLQREQASCPPAPAVLQATADSYRARMGCPSAGLRTNVATAWQPFEQGMMLWVQNEDVSGGKIYVVFRDTSTGIYYWRVFNDTYVEGEPVNTDVLPPPGLYVPFRGFGKLWRDNEWVRGALGFATLPERADVGLVQPFDQGRAQMVYRQGQNMVLVMFRVEHSGAGQAYEQPPVR